MTLRVLDEGPHHLVVQKPADTLVVKGRGPKKPTLLDQVNAHLGKPALPVHRLDRVTTGCCVFAKTRFGQQALSDAFRRRLVDKRYLALVEGAVSFTKLSVDARLLRVDTPDAKKGPLATQTVDDQGQRALTHLRRLTPGDPALLLCHPVTGRMHQIRVHLAHVGHPIVGDGQYGATSSGLGPHHIGLHALLISFPKPSGGRAFVAAPPPETLLAAAGQGAAEAVAEVTRTFLNKAKKAPAGEGPKSPRQRPQKGRAGPQKKPGGPGTKAPRRGRPRRRR